MRATQSELHRNLTGTLQDRCIHANGKLVSKMHEVDAEDSVPPLSEKPRTRAARVVVEEGQIITRVEEIDDSMDK